jgi:hypothetical protein
MNNNLESNLSRLADKLAEASKLLGTKIVEDRETYEAYSAIAEAQAILWTIGEDAQEDINRLGEELESRLLQKGWVR